MWLAKCPIFVNFKCWGVDAFIETFFFEYLISVTKWDVLVHVVVHRFFSFVPSGYSYIAGAFFTQSSSVPFSLLPSFLL